MNTLCTMIACGILLSACSTSSRTEETGSGSSLCVTSMTTNGDHLSAACSADLYLNGTYRGQLQLTIDGQSKKGSDQMDTAARLMPSNTPSSTLIHIHIDDTTSKVTFSSPNGDFAIHPDSAPDQLWAESQHVDSRTGGAERPDARDVSCPGLDEFVQTLQDRPIGSLRDAYYPCGELEGYADSLDVVRDNRKPENEHLLAMAKVAGDEMFSVLSASGGTSRFVFAFTKVAAAVNAAVQLGQNNYNSSYQNQGTNHGRWDVRNRR